MKQAHIQQPNQICQFILSDSKKIKPKEQDSKSSFDFRILRIHFPDFDSLLSEVITVKTGGLLS